ncbi:hypothetical protein B0H14DRAFT_3525036 [Mycena olivaceomarginata]|nr:hypothetical protein B0H14DRAFT_3525036 [Mycena olivaceomarginata]
MTRLIWYHVPPRLTPNEMGKVMVKKRMALNLVEAFTVSLSHHLCGELGIYYEDLYDLVRPLHDFTDPENPRPIVASAVPPPPGRGRLHLNFSTLTSSTSNTLTSTSTSGVSTATLKVSTHTTKRPSSTSASSHTSQTSLHQPLLPVSNPAPEDGVLRCMTQDVIPFTGVLTGMRAWVRGVWGARKDDMGWHQILGTPAAHDFAIVIQANADKQTLGNSPVSPYSLGNPPTPLPYPHYTETMHSSVFGASTMAGPGPVGFGMRGVGIPSPSLAISDAATWNN